jgi:hypothetical protein
VIDLDGECRPPACRERRCTLIRRGELTSTRVEYQHGENPEAVLVLDGAIESGYVRITTYRRFVLGDLNGVIPPAALEDWVEKVHAYEDGGGGR